VGQREKSKGRKKAPEAGFLPSSKHVFCRKRRGGQAEEGTKEGIVGGGRGVGVVGEKSSLLR